MGLQAKNTISGLLNQAAAIVVGLLLSRLMIGAFGSEVYGLSTSVTQFLSYITLLEGGIGSVARAALYQASANPEEDRVSPVLRAINLFFKKIAVVFLGYLLVLAVVYPRYIHTGYDALFTGSLICIIGISSLAQYSFGITYSIFLQAEGKFYVIHIVQIGTCLLNALVAWGLITLGASFHVVKLASALVFVLRPICFNLYVRRRYVIDHHAAPAVLPQRGSGMLQHLAWFLTANTDVVVITFLGALTDVAVYSVYYMVASSMTKLCLAVTSGFEAKLGHKMAHGEEKASIDSFERFVMLNTSGAILLFTTAGCMLMPFVTLYTRNITDADYSVPLLGFSLLLAEGLHVLRHPYASLCIAVGHFKQTQAGSLWEAGLNVVLSVVLMQWMGVAGVAVATVIALGYRTLDFLIHVSRRVLGIGLGRHLLLLCGALLLSGGIVWAKLALWPAATETYLQWVAEAMGCMLLSALGCLLYNSLFFRKQWRALWISFAGKGR